MGCGPVNSCGISNEGILVTQNLVMKYPGAPVSAVNGLTISINEGEIFGLLGPNGAGKTTAISIMNTLMRPGSGTVTICGIDAIRYPSEVKGFIGYVPQEIALYPTMSVRENLRFMGRIYDLKGKDLEARIDECIDFVGLERGADARVHTYSGGMKRRANLAAGILHKPKILFLDEPTVGIDPQSRNLILEKLVAMKGETTMIYTTHYMGEVEQICSRMAIMDTGHIIVEGTLKDLYDHVPGSTNLEEVFIGLTGKQLRD